MTSVLERFLQYVAYDTQSAEEQEQVPSTQKQFRLAEALVKELEAIGAEDVSMDEHCYVYATIPATTDQSKTVLGLIAHMDTSPAVSGAEVKPAVIRNYDGRDVILNHGQNIILRTDDFPEIRDYTGQTLIVTDGTTLLGSDDKAGIAEILTAAEYLLSHPEIAHGKIRIGFTPDEEVGRGVDYFDVKKFGADFAYTVDGGRVGELEYENFNAAAAKLKISGTSIHPGGAKGRMLNAVLLGMEFQNLLPVFQNPACTEHYEGFFHLENMSGTVETAVLNYIIRDHDIVLFEQKKGFIC